MISSPHSQQRLLIPRWRSLAVTIATKELATPRRMDRLHKVDAHEPELVYRLDRWRKSPETVTAAEVVESALVLGQEHEAVAAARFLASQASGATPLLRSQANALLVRVREAPVPPSPGKNLGLAYWRERTRVYPHDALAWVEVALAHITSRHIEQAKRAMTVALQLAPYDRHVLRSAARFYFHIRDPERAYDLIRRNSATPHDPWLMATELALAVRLKRSPAFLKMAMAALDGRSFLPSQITELAGAAASTYLTGAGPHRRSRRLFALSMADPTANAIAQAEWASQSYNERFLEEERLKSFSFANEAQAMHAFNEGRFEDSLRAAQAWIAEEPFSSRAFLGAASAANLSEAYPLAIELATQGLRFDPKSTRLRNSLAFSFGSTDQLDRAEEVLRDLTGDDVDRVHTLIAEANRGLIAMRRGELERAEQLYRKAIDGFRHAGMAHLQKLALAYLAREAALADHPKAAAFIAEAKDSVANTRHHSAMRVIPRAERYLAMHAVERAGS